MLPEDLTSDMSADPVAAFIGKWRPTSGAERANYVSFLNELCDLLGVTRPDPTVEDDDRNTYVFERRVRKLDIEGDATANFIDLYKRGCFVLEAKQSKKRQRAEPAEAGLFDKLPGQTAKASWDKLMKQARYQAERYAKNLPTDHGWPPFLVVVDVGHVIELYADFSGLGKAYLPFPDARTHRIGLADLADPAIRDRLRAVWDDPQALDPARRRVEVTRAIADRLARLAISLEKRHAPKTVALFLMRCLFTGFAEDVGLLPTDCFLELLRRAKDRPEHLPHYLTPLWQDMDRGARFNAFIEAPVRHFNGGLFKDAEALPLDSQEITTLIEAVRADWRNVEPAIFGALLENALDERERARLGAHFTPRVYVDRLVIPTLLEPLLEDWASAQAAAEAKSAKGDHAGAVAEIKAFHLKLCETRVLDPACGTGNFLYVALEHMKRLEGEVLVALEQFGVSAQGDLDLAGHTVGPDQFIGLEANPRAVPIAELVIWLGHLQWHLRHRDVKSLGEPILKPFETIREGDAVLSWRKAEIHRDEEGRPVSRWDGRSYRTDPLTGREVPDETQTVELMRYHDPRPAEWPKADFIVGNPPFVAGKDLRAELGDGYAEALWQAYPHMPRAADYVMYWWDKAASLVRAGKARRFGFISTNSIRQTFCRRVIQAHMTGGGEELPIVGLRHPGPSLGGWRRHRGRTHRHDGRRGGRGAGIAQASETGSGAPGRGRDGAGGA